MFQILSKRFKNSFLFSNKNLSSLPIFCLSTQMENKRSFEKSQETDLPNSSNDNNDSFENLKSPSKRKKLLDLIDTRLDISDYYIENNNRKVYPYPFTYYAYCKGRWVGRTLKELFAMEFRALSPESINHRVEKGYLKVNGKSVDGDYVLKDNDFITNRIHRHESPVLATSIPIIHSDDELLVIDKPPSLPVHACGKYRFNTIIALLEKENNFKDLHTVHRLDRLTSGIMVIAKTKAKAQKLHEEMRNRVMQKEYVCRVEGRFPDGIVECEEPIETLAHRIALCIVSPQGKPSKTTFERLNYNGKSSTVLCKPFTGRMHQIRVHLQYLGHPIVNDNLYNSQVFGEKKGFHGDFGGKSREQLIKDLENAHKKSNYIITSEEQHLDQNDDERNVVALKALHHYTSQQTWNDLKKNYVYDASKMIIEDDCEECQVKTLEPTAHEQLIYLHALRYKGENWSFQTNMPIWAQETWTYD